MTISKYSINNFFLYSALFSAMFFLQIIPGLYMFDLILFLYVLLLLICGIAKLPLENLEFLGALLFFLVFPMVISLFFNYVISTDVQFGMGFFYYLWNIFLLFIYIIAFYNQKENIINININFFMIVLIFPLILSVLSFFIRDLMVFIKSLYHIDAFGVFGRYGGIYGMGIAGYGMLSFTVLLLSMYLYKIKKIYLSVFLLGMIFSLVSLFLSGIRTGLIVMLLLIVFLALLRKENLLSFKNSVIILLVSIISLLFITNQFPILGDILSARFSLEKLLVDFQLIESTNHGSNFELLFGAFDKNIKILSENWITILFGTTQARHDVFYVDYVIKHGIFSMLMLGMFMLWLLLKIKIFKKLIQYELFLLMLFFIGFVISFKANSMFNNYYMFAVTFVYVYLKYSNISNFIYKKNKKDFILDGK